MFGVDSPNMSFEAVDELLVSDEGSYVVNSEQMLLEPMHAVPLNFRISDEV